PIKESTVARGKKRQTESFEKTKGSPSKKAKVSKQVQKSRAVVSEDESELSEEEEIPKKTAKSAKSKPTSKGKRVVSEETISDSEDEKAPKKPSTPKKRAPKPKTSRVVSAEEIISDDDVEMKDGIEAT